MLPRRGQGFDPWSGNSDPARCAVQPKKKEFSGKTTALMVLRISNQPLELETAGFGTHSDNTRYSDSTASRSQDITVNQSWFLVSGNSAFTG